MHSCVCVCVCVVLHNFSYVSSCNYNQMQNYFRTTSVPLATPVEPYSPFPQSLPLSPVLCPHNCVVSRMPEKWNHMGLTFFTPNNALELHPGCCVYQIDFWNPDEVIILYKSRLKINPRNYKCLSLFMMEKTNSLLDKATTVSYTHLTLPTTGSLCRSRWSPYH